jgi:hypothetical protein
MQHIEPFYNWRHIYTAEDDPKSPFFGREYSEFEYSNTIYNFYIHPQWDDFGSTTLYCKILIADIEEHYAIIEFIGEWNDTLENDIATLRAEVIQRLAEHGINKFILIGENILNFHVGEKEYYKEWFEEVVEEEGWIVLLNMPEQSAAEFKKAKLHYYVELIDKEDWRRYKPYHLFKFFNEMQNKRLSF